MDAAVGCVALLLILGMPIFGVRSDSDEPAYEPGPGTTQCAVHSVGVLFRVYAKFLRDRDESANAKISARLRGR